MMSLQAQKSRNFLCVSALLLTASLASAQAVINLSSTKQTIDGYGGMNFQRWQPGLTDSLGMSETAFGTGPGQVGLSILRTNMSPDSVDWARELPAIKMAHEHGATILASQWSVPLSMKTSAQQGQPAKLEGGRLKPESYGAYANYMNQFGDYLRRNGADLHVISPANEPDCPVMYETTEWSATEITNFIKNNGPTVKAKLLAAETFQFNKSYSDMILNDATATANIDIIGAHPYGISNLTSVMAYPKAAEKGKGLWMTEHYTTTSGTNPNQANLWPDALEAGKEVHTFMTLNYNAYIWWYIRRNYGLITDDGKITKRGSAFSHFARFVRPGFVRVDVPVSPSNGLLVTAYKKDKDVAVVIINSNNSTSSQAFTLSNGTATVPAFKKFVTSSSKTATEDPAPVTVTNNAFTVSLDAQSITTLTYTAVTTGNIEKPKLASSDAFHPGNYQVFDVSGAKVGTLQLSEGQNLDSEVRKVVGKSGLFVVSPLDGTQSQRINVNLR